MSEKLVPPAAAFASPIVPAQAQAAVTPDQVPRVQAAQALTPEYIMKHAVTPAMRGACSEPGAAAGLRAASLGAKSSAQPHALTPNAPPDYFGPYPNYANSPLPAVDPCN